ncbi:hypothetical protein RJ639_045377 [Escallonia herrerae]|uniref:Wound-induced protein 1 n=1 Tax=Escallonia herrerae TaxID=1293975 RepID=A0AA88W9U2_9ASTE|nr:hypothetical protein RJ639_045377 [Escallonia herrerae]
MAGQNEEESNTMVVSALYEALSSGDVDTVHWLLAPAIERWFHGPHCHQQHMVQLLTGKSSNFTSTTAPSAKQMTSSFIFRPVSIFALGSLVLVEGGNRSRNVTWVHAWSVTEGIITHVREYFNTSVTATRFEKSKTLLNSGSCRHVWESKLCDSMSVPGLILVL